MKFPAALLTLAILTSHVAAEPPQIPNKLIDAEGFADAVTKSHELRKTHRLSEADFIKLANDPKTVILDARSAGRFRQLHIKGAKNLPFTEFTVDTLAKIIPSSGTRILIYCNNNVENSPIAFASKMAPAALNLSTYASLYSYGYKNVYELGPVIDPTK